VTDLAGVCTDASVQAIVVVILGHFLNLTNALNLGRRE
jgi:hypothetical protein